MNKYKVVIVGAQGSPPIEVDGDKFIIDTSGVLTIWREGKVKSGFACGEWSYFIEDDEKVVSAPPLTTEQSR